MVSLPQFHTCHVVIVGDVMLDRYWLGSTDRISPEAPVPVVRVQQCQERLGGAGNVALNVRALGAQTTLFSIIGHDADGALLKQQLAQAEINEALVVANDSNTTCKLRVLSHQQQLVRLDFEAPYENRYGKEIADKLLSSFDAAIDVIVLSDYAKGTLAEAATIISAAQQKGVPILIDPKGTDFHRYKGATLLTPNKREFEAVMGACANEDTLVEKALLALDKFKLDALLITRGEEGMTLVRPHHPPFHLKAEAKEVYDVTGAGDTVIGVLATCLAGKMSLEEAVRAANAAASVVVSKLGAATVSHSELMHALHSRQGSVGVLTESAILHAVNQARALGERIVVTNGCFDLLHIGHLQYLTEAKALGDRLIVLVNDDASVKRLKGSKRPITPLQERMTLLAGLSVVDWVVPFSEETPARLIKALAPDVLVKGGDYQAIEDIAGASSVLARGGEVKVLSYVPDISTSHIIERIQKG